MLTLIHNNITPKVTGTVKDIDIRAKVSTIVTFTFFEGDRLRDLFII